MKKRLLCLLLALIMTVSIIPTSVFADGGETAATSEQTIVQTGSNKVDASSLLKTSEETGDGYHAYINPVYSDIITEADLKQPGSAAVKYFASPYKATSVEKAADYVRKQMKGRAESFSLTITETFYYQEDVDALAVALLNMAVGHTGAPTEGDYILWVYGGGYYRYSIDQHVSGNKYKVTIEYFLTYYTTAAQEKEMDTAVAKVMSKLNLSGKNNYAKVKAIYDYICNNVVYDYAHLNTPNYMLQYTAYAALVKGTAVCQGYAVLFYRLALAAGVDARFIGGYAGGPHAWNIAQMDDGKYYYLDSTWDSEMGGYYFWFLKCQKSFSVDHTNDPEWSTSAWNRAYPIGSKDYDANKHSDLSTPKLQSVENTATGVKITWSKVSGAAKYRVLYKTSGGTWKKAGDTTKTSYTWTKGKSGTKYTFTVRCLNSMGTAYTSSYNKTGLSIKYIAAPKLTSLTNASKGVTIKWDKVAGAEKYRVYYKTSANGSWKKLADTTKTSYTWKKAKSGTTYYFSVGCVSSDGKTETSGYDTTGKSISYTNYKLASPKISSVSDTSSGIKISWGKVSGAAKYRIYYKTSANGSWKKLTDTTATSYTWKKAKSGTTYYFSVGCVSSDGKTKTSGYDIIGQSIKAK